MNEIEEAIEVTPKTTINPKVVRTIKNLQALYNEDANKIVDQAAQGKATKGSLNFLIICLYHHGSRRHDAYRG